MSVSTFFTVPAKTVRDALGKREAPRHVQEGRHHVLLTTQPPSEQNPRGNVITVAPPVLDCEHARNSALQDTGGPSWLA